MTYHRNYCEECDWAASTETHGQRELAALAIDHYIETNHPIESEAVAELGR